MNLRTLRAGVELLLRIPGFLNRPLTVEEARQIQARALEDRARLFLRFVRDAIYASPEHPLHRLLVLAGCEYGDLESLVVHDGLEETLRTLLRNGVYVTVDEFKGRRQAVRGSATIELDPARLRNPLADFHVTGRSGGSRSGGTPVLIDLAFVRACAVAQALWLHVRGGDDWLKAVWETPGAGARFRLLKGSCFGRRPVAWFTQVAPDDPALAGILRWSERALRWGAGLGGVPLPRPVLATLEDPRPLLRWLRQTLDRHETPHVQSFPSSIVRLATVALESGIDIRGAHATMSGEPITQVRLDITAKAGVICAPRYGAMESGPIAYACQHPQAPDDTHVLAHLHSVIQAADAGEDIGLPPRALLITSLHPASPFAMLNLSMGDEADLTVRACGCPLEALGWGPHLCNIRSYEKLTAGGMTFYDGDLIDVLERVLPQRFGGNAADYQLVEEDDDRGQPHLMLLVHSRLGPLDEEQIKDAFLRAIGGGTVEGMMSTMWRRSGMVRVERRPPLTTAASKILHLHVKKPAPPS